MARVIAEFRKAFDSGVVTTAMVCVLLAVTYAFDKYTQQDMRFPLRLLDLLCVVALLFWQFGRFRRQRQRDLELQTALNESKAQVEEALSELEKSRASLDLALRVGGLGVWHVNIQLNRDLDLSSFALLDTEILADARSREIFGVGAQTITFRDVIALWHPSEYERLASLFTADHIQSLREYRDHRRIIRADGSPRMVEIRAGLEVGGTSEDGTRDISVTGIVKDITEEEELKVSLQTKAEEARLAKEAKGQFLAMMSHEIRTPLSGVLGMIDLVLDTTLNDDQRGMLVRSRQSAVALLTIINDILDFSKVEAGKLDLESAPISLRSLLEDVCETLKLQILHKPIALTYDVAEEIPTYLLGDSVRMRQILTNLINNAIKFTPKGGVHACARRDAQGQLQLVVEDTGIGMSEAVLQSLFQPFQQADVATTRRFGGTGLGLSIVKRLVDLMGGAVTCESEEGAGTRFVVTVPFHAWIPTSGGASVSDRLHAHAARGPSSDEAILDLMGLRVLLAEDHPVNQEVIIRQLAKLGVVCDCVEDGQQAWECLSSGDAHYAALLTDCHMPRLDGYELTTRIRAREAEQDRPRLPIIALTANALRGERERCLELGMDEYLAKPMQLQELKDALLKTIPRTGQGTSPAGYRKLVEVCAGDRDVVRKVLNVFISFTSSALMEMERAVHQGDHLRLRQMVHKLGSGCRQLDEARAVELLEAIEVWNSESEDAAAAVPLELCEQAQTELKAVIDRATRYVASQAPLAS